MIRIKILFKKIEITQTSIKYCNFTQDNVKLLKEKQKKTTKK